MADRYRWLTAEGNACSPRHRSVTTAATWLARQARHPRKRPAPAVLVREVAGRAGRSRYAALTARERAALVIAAPRPREAPSAAESWLKRAADSSRSRARARASLPKMTARLQRATLPSRPRVSGPNRGGTDGQDH